MLDVPEPSSNVYYHQQELIFQIFTQFIVAIDVIRVTIRRLNSINDKVKPFVGVYLRSFSGHFQKDFNKSHQKSMFIFSLWGCKM